MSDDLLTALINGGFLILGAMLGFGANLLTSWLDHRRESQRQEEELQKTERAIFSGVFALTNFLSEKLIAWEQSRNVPDLARLSVAQSHLQQFIARSPNASERLQISLIELALRLESLLFLTGFTMGERQPENYDIDAVSDAIEEVAGAIETVDIMLNSTLNFVTDEWLAEHIEGFVLEDKKLGD